MLIYPQKKIAVDAPERHKLSVHVLSNCPKAVSEDVSGDEEKCDLLPVPELPMVSVPFLDNLNSFIHFVYFYLFFK